MNPTDKTFPILYGFRKRTTRTDPGPTSVPWAMVAQHEARALKNHGQTLSRLAERGGLDPVELLAVLDDKPWPNRRQTRADIENLIQRVHAFTTRAADETK